MSTIRRNFIWGRLAIIVTGLLVGISVPARAAFIVNMYNDGSGNVVATGNGTINTDGLIAAGVGFIRPAAFADNNTIGLGGVAGTFNQTDSFQGISTLGSTMGPGSSLAATSTTGDIVEISGVGTSTLYLPSGYISESLLSNTATWSGQTIDTLGLTPGTYEWTWGSGSSADSFTVNISEEAPSATPEPTSVSMLLLGAGGLGVVSLRRRKMQMQAGNFISNLGRRI